MIRFLLGNPDHLKFLNLRIDPTVVLQEGVETASRQSRAHHRAERYHGRGAQDVGKVDALTRAAEVTDPLVSFY